HEPEFVPVYQHPLAAFLRLQLDDSPYPRTLLKETPEYFCSLHNWDAPSQECLRTKLGSPGREPQLRVSPRSQLSRCH
ncbi:MAG: hypothetical protein LH702_10245, partial [Phormidesmis sp. CAN_BIN44]|nr:hypothetical protein [Phormidesmis sp. CAN_BIN44]